jgi:peptidoglycan/LPS O-acetylase OafA/YrhL
MRMVRTGRPIPLTVTRTAALSPAFSLYLDAARFGAALAVLAAHLAHKGFIGPIADYGREAVIVFFVISGYVIAHTASARDHTLGAYVRARTARIYSVAVPVLLLSWTVALAAHALFAVPLPYQLNKTYLYLPFHLLFAGEHWTLAEVPPRLEPYWSLCYEAWYYVLFGCAFYLRGAGRWMACLLVLAVVGPKIAMLLPVWLGGVCLYKLEARTRMGATQAALGWACSLVMIVWWGASSAEPVLRQLGQQLWPFPSVSPGTADRYLADYAVGLLVLINFACARQLPWRRLGAARAFIRAGSRYTFSLYLTHMLVLFAARQCFGPGHYSPLGIALLLCALAVVAIAVGELGEWLRAVMLGRTRHQRAAGALGSAAAPPG